ncbi:MAG: hypothetical protein AMXMBFR61_11450 [Fimbriimonadales bacterium]
MYRLFGKALVLFALPAIIAGCGGGGGLSSDSRSYSGTLNFTLGGAPVGFDVTTAVVTASKLEVRSKATGQYETLWSGTREVDLLASEPQEFSGQVTLGSEMHADFDSLRVTLSHVVLQDTELGSFDQDVAWSFEFPLDMRMVAGRKALLRAVLPLAAFQLQEDSLVLSEDVVVQANVSDQGVLEPRWVDAVYLDLSHLPYEIPLPTGGVATGIWFSNDNMGFFVDDQDGSGGEFYSWYDGEFSKGGTYEYDDPQKSSLTWRVDDALGVETGTAYALRTVCPLRAGGWSALVMTGGKAEHGVFILVKTDSNRNIVEIYGGDVVLNDENDPTKGGTAEILSLYDVLNQSQEAVPAEVGLTYDGKVSGTYSISGGGYAVPATGSWVLYVPGG